MPAEITSFWKWQHRYSDEKAGVQALIKWRWPEGFRWEGCGHPKGGFIETRTVYEGADCHPPTPVTAGTWFHNPKLSWVKGFGCRYRVSPDPGSMSALRLPQLIGVSGLPAQRLLRQLRLALGDQQSQDPLSGIIELDEAWAGGQRAGQRGRGAAGKTAIGVAGDHPEGQPGLVAMTAVERVTPENVRAFAEPTLAPGPALPTEAFAALKVLAGEPHPVAKVTAPELSSEGLPWVHGVISHFKSSLSGTYQGVAGP